MGKLFLSSNDIQNACVAKQYQAFREQGRNPQLFLRGVGQGARLHFLSRDAKDVCGIIRDLLTPIWANLCKLFTQVNFSAREIHKEQEKALSYSTRIWGAIQGVEKTLQENVSSSFSAEQQKKLVALKENLHMEGNRFKTHKHTLDDLESKEKKLVQEIEHLRQENTSLVHEMETMKDK